MEVQKFSVVVVISDVYTVVDAVVVTSVKAVMYVVTVVSVVSESSMGVDWLGMVL